jgi:hypothetical protein
MHSVGRIQNSLKSKLVVHKVTTRLSMADTGLTKLVECQCVFYVSFDSENKVTSLKNLLLFLKNLWGCEGVNYFGNKFGDGRTVLCLA